MKDRTHQILEILIYDFVKTAHPVASNYLIENYDFKISSATVRNEFSLLEDVGLICAPHASSGKTPTEKGYRYFVENIMPMHRDKEAMVARENFSEKAKEYRLAKSKESLFDVLRVVASVSGNLAFVSIDSDKTFYVGMSHVMRTPEFVRDPEKAAKIIEILEGKNSFLSFLNTLQLSTEEARIFIGEENLLAEISSCSLIAIAFDTPHHKGVFGILGPTRMQYAYNKALLEESIQMIV